ncbi:MAG: DUF4386 domain-containing protein [Bacteroidales bacterium]|nr:DUF4386 domain-containing protein [Bacteroidales bacterium]MBN2763439.1 DUF4386 domain-containing protein [Bacteroidales bacterium]
MNSVNKTSRIIGIAFLMQVAVSIAAMITGLMLKNQCVIPGNTAESLSLIAANLWLLKANVAGELLTSVTLTFLGTVLFLILRKQQEIIALFSMGLYVLAAGILAVSRFANFCLMDISREYLTAGPADYLLTTGKMALDAMDFGITLMQLPICIGAGLFYFLFFQSRIVPRLLSLYGMITMFILTVATFFALYGYATPVFLLALYAPVEPAMATWLLVKGVKVE